MHSKNKYLLWIDCEMTGLDPQKDHILELAYILTDQNCNTLLSDTYIIHQPNERLDCMGAWCTKNHEESGLTQASKKSTLSYKDVEQSLIEALKQYAKNSTVWLAGNSIWNDRNFIQAHMPIILRDLHYRLVDVSSLKIAYQLWRPESKEFIKKKHHRALDDIRESIAEFLFYKNNFNH